MKKKIYAMIFASLLTISGCNTNNSSTNSNNNSNSSTNSTLPSTNSSSSVDKRITLEDISNELLGKIGQNEVLRSNEVDFLEIDKRGDSRVTTYEETMYIYNDYTSVANGTIEAKYLTNGVETKKEESYQRVATAIMYDTVPVFYLVTDYEDGTLNTSWSDSADRLPIKNIGDPNYDGIDYLLASSLPGQTTKQVSLIMYNFIRANFLGNPDLQASMPYATKDINNNITTYKLENFSYSYSDNDGSTVQTELGFNIKVESGNLVETSTLYKTTTIRGNEEYIEENTTSYKISYDERVASTTNENMLNVEDYFVYEVGAVQAYFYNDEGDKEIASLNNLPLDKYIRFEATDYAPSKAVDIEMYPVSSSNNDIVEISGNVFFTKASGEAELTIQSATGIEFKVDVRVNIPEITKIKYDDSSSDVERGDNNQRYIYTNTTYSDGIYVSVNPSSAKLDDVQITVSNEEVLTVESKVIGKVLELTLVVSDNVDLSLTNSVKITFTSKVNPEVKTEITFNLKQRLSNEELIEKLMSNTYKWTNIYEKNTYGLMTFSSSTEGKVEYYDEEGLVGTTTFTYSINNTSFNINANDGSLYGYNSGEITLDGTMITARVDDVTYVHRYEIVEK